MRIALVNPNTCRKTTGTMVGIAAAAAGRGTLVEGHTARFGAPLITEPQALDDAAKAVLALLPALAGADAIIVSAFGDPGLDGLRAHLDRPVTGIAEAGMAEAGAFGRRFAVVTTTPELAPRIARAAERYGQDGFAGTWTTPADPVALAADPVALASALSDAIEQAIEKADVSAVVIGGGPLAVAARSIAETSRVPLIEPISAAVRLTMSRLGVECPA
ncbi:MAG: aspartate/glutamate racemase family protein [Pseudomonadota bacterium]